MNARKLFSRHLLSIIVAISIVIIGLLINFVRGIADDAVIESTFDEMDQIGVQYQNLLSNTLEEAREDLILLAQFVDKNDVSGDNVVAYLDSQSQTREFSALHYIDLDGNGICADGESRDFAQNPSFLAALNNESYTQNPHISIETSEVVFDLAVPVMRGDETTAVLFSEVSVEDFFETISYYKDYEGDIFFVDQELNMIFSTSETHVGEITIPERDIIEMGVENVVQAQQNIINKQSSGFYYDYFGTPKVMVYYPIYLTDVALAMNVEVHSLSSEMVRAAQYFDVTGSIIYWTIITLVIAIAIIHSRSNKRILKTAYYDTLTQLPNFAKLKLEMQSLLKQDKQRYTIIVYDIENFKAINEVFGYEMGDRVLKTMKFITREIEEPSLITARIGDDKFAMFARSELLEDINIVIDHAVCVYDEMIPELINYNGTFKIGRYKIDEGETNVDEIMSKVSMAHNASKERNGEWMCDYDETFKKTLQKEADITNRMKLALENGEFKAFLQPKFSINNDKIVGAEALVRWIQADGSIVYPNDFIPLFERNGFIVDVDRFIFEEVCKIIRHWLDEGHAPMTVSVNCSRINLLNPYFVDGIVAIADKHNVPHEQIEVELTESTTIDGDFTIEQLFEDLHKHGFKISIDDFGAGYSSLGMLKNLDVDTLKMDRSFFVGGKNARRDDMLVDSIVKMAHNLGMYVVAEGIETLEQVELLMSMNCDCVQGYFYDKPMSLEDFEEKYHDMMSMRADDSDTPIINRINDIKYASSFVPGGIIVAKVDSSFTIVEANDYFFNMIGYTRKEVRDEFANRGVDLMAQESKRDLLDYFKLHRKDTGILKFISKFVLRSGEEHLFKLNGKIAPNEKGEARVYASVTDVTDHFKADSDLQQEKTFIARISELTDSAFFDFNKEANTIRFSKNFARKFDVPEIIDNFIGSKLADEIFPGHKDLSFKEASGSNTNKGTFSMVHASGRKFWYEYHCKVIYDEKTNRPSVVGMISEIIDRSRSARDKA